MLYLTFPLANGWISYQRLPGNTLYIYIPTKLISPWAKSLYVACEGLSGYFISGSPVKMTFMDYFLLQRIVFHSHNFIGALQGVSPQYVLVVVGNYLRKRGEAYQQESPRNRRNQLLTKHDTPPLDSSCHSNGIATCSLLLAFVPRTRSFLLSQ